MARGNKKPTSLQSDFGDRVFSHRLNEKALVIGERTEANAELHDAIKGHEAAFQKFLTMVTLWEDGVTNPVKVALRDAYEELPDSIKKIVTEPPETIKELYRGVNNPAKHYLREMEDRYQEKYDKITDRLEKANSKVPINEERIKELEQEFKELEQEEREDFNNLRESQGIVGWSKSLGTASKFGDYILRGSQDVESVGPIIKTERVNQILKAVFKEDSVLNQYKRGLDRFYASTEGEYITLNTKLVYGAETHSGEWRNKNYEWIQGLRDERRRREREAI